MRRIKTTLNFQMNHRIIEHQKQQLHSKCHMGNKILRKHQLYNPDTKSCSLHLNEKLEMTRYKGHNLQKKLQNFEIINKCPHHLYEVSQVSGISVFLCSLAYLVTMHMKLYWLAAQVKSIILQKKAIPCASFTSKIVKVNHRRIM